MPKWLHKKLKKGADKKGLKGKDAAAYIYSTLADYEVKHKKSKKSKAIAKPK